MPHTSNPYESDVLLNQYLFFHFGVAGEQFPYGFGGKDGVDFPLRCVREGLDVSKLSSTSRALDLGCAVGRSTFELARIFEQVIGIDYSQGFVDAANELKLNGSHAVQVLKEGDLHEEKEVSVELDIHRDRIQFEQGDAQYLRSDLGTFDAVLACNLICRLPEPRKLIDRLPDMVNTGGQLFLTTPFTWLAEFTPRENWLGEGVQDSFSSLQKLLGPHFLLDHKFDMPFLIPETARKFQYTIALASRWIRK
jgi:putative 4-mercaptohistidine N1-methyltranferase